MSIEKRVSKRTVRDFYFWTAAQKTGNSCVSQNDQIKLQNAYTSA